MERPQTFSSFNLTYNTVFALVSNLTDTHALILMMSE